MYLERTEKYREYTIVFTDGSKTDSGAGCGVFIHNEGQFSVTLNQYTSVFHAELIAIKWALEYFLNKGSRKILVCTDSFSSLGALKDKFTEDPLLSNILQLIQNLSLKGITTSFLWIPGHSGIEGNDRADFLAKLATSTSAPTNSDMHLHVKDQKNKIKNMIYFKWQNEFNNRELFIKNTVNSVKTKSNIIINRHDDVVLTRLRIGHTRLTHSHHLVGRRRPICGECGSLLDVRHILVDCPAFQETRRQHQLPDALNDLLYREEAQVKRLTDYLRDIKMYNLI